MSQKEFGRKKIFNHRKKGKNLSKALSQRWLSKRKN